MADHQEHSSRTGFEAARRIGLARRGTGLVALDVVAGGAGAPRNAVDGG